jgi:hypothetical protein
MELGKCEPSKARRQDAIAVSGKMDRRDGVSSASASQAHNWSVGLLLGPKLISQLFSSCGLGACTPVAGSTSYISDQPLPILVSRSLILHLFTLLDVSIVCARLLFTRYSSVKDCLCELHHLLT